MSKGIDIHIDALVNDFNNLLWTSLTKRSFYGRVFRNERNDSISPEIWITPHNYIEVLKDYKFDAQCFFDRQPNIDINSNVQQATVWICFMVNLQAIYPTLTRTEATEQVHWDVKGIVEHRPFIVQNLVTGFSGFDSYDWGEDGQYKADMSPHYLFRFETFIDYANC